MRLGAVVGLGLAAAVALTIGLWPRSEPASTRDSGADVGAPSAARAGAAPSADRSNRRAPRAPDRWQLGAQRVWSVTATQTTTLADDARAFETRYAGTWAVTPTDDDGALLRLRATFEPDPDAMAELPEATREALSAQLSKPFFLTVKRRGQLADLHLDPSVAHRAEAILRALVASFLHTTPAEPGAATWQAEEADGAGVYLAAYRREPGEVLVRSRLRYLKLTAPQTEPSTLTGTHASRFEVDAGGWAERIRVEDDETFEGIPKVRSEYRATFERLRPDAVATAQIGAFAREQAELRAAGATGQDSGQARAKDLLAEWDAERTEGRDLDEIVAALKALEETPEDVEARHGLQRVLTALLRQDPEAAAAVAQQIRDGQPPAVQQTLLGALAGTDSAEAHGALRDLLTFADGEDGDATLLRDVSISLALAARASPEAVDDLLALAQRRSDTSTWGAALLAAGAQGRNLGEGEALDEVVGRLSEQAKAETDPKRHATTLSALGNTGHSQAEQLILDATTHGSPSVRAAAVYALRFMTGAGVDAAIRQVLVGDAHPQVRLQALACVPFRSFAEHQGPIARALVRDPSADVRSAALTLLEDRGEWALVLSSVLTLVAKGEPEPTIKARAQALLDRVQQGAVR